MNPETSSAVFGLLTILGFLLTKLLVLVGIFGAGGLLLITIDRLRKRFPNIKIEINELRGASDSFDRADYTRRCVDEVKSRLSLLDKVIWYSLLVLGVSYVAISSNLSDVKIPGIEVPVRQFGVVFYAIFLGGIIYYLRVISSLETILSMVEDEKDVKIQLVQHSGFLSPFSESGNVSGWILDIVGFNMLVAVWWVSFDIGRKLLAKGEFSGLIGHFVPYLPWAAATVGVFALYFLQQSMYRFSVSKTLFYAKLLCACISLPVAWFAVHEV